MKKLCMVVFNYYEIDSRVRRQAEFIADSGWSVDIITLKSPFTDEAPAHPNIRMYGLSVAKLRGSFFRYLFQYALFCFLSFWLLTFLHVRRRYAVIQIHTLPDFLIFSAMIPKLLGCPLLLDMHEITPEFFSSKYAMDKTHMIIRFLQFIETICIGFATHVITVNESIRELLISRGTPPEKISTILDSADEKLFSPCPADEKTPQGAFVLMYHGTLTEIYGLDVAIRSLLHLTDVEREKLEMRIAGDGPEEERLKRLVAELGLEETVKFLGRHPLSEMPGIIAKCDAGICPTTDNELTTHSLSTKLLEYVYMCKPIIASRLKTYQKYFDDTCMAYFSPGNDMECGEKIHLLIADEKLRKTLAENAKNRYKDLSWSLVKDSYYQVITTLGGKPD
jgi:glycosyltransferase involved in cell wall biosynthesis